MSTIEQVWNYQLAAVSADRSVVRPEVPKGSAARLAGVDGRLKSGARPIPGFRRVHDLEFHGDSFVSLPNTLHSSRSVVTDFFPVSFRIASDGYGYGFVYRALRSDPADGLADIFVDFWNSRVDTTDFGVKGLVVAQGVDPAAQVHVEVGGRFVYVFIEGRSPAMFYVDAQTTREYAAIEDKDILESGTPIPGTLSVGGVTADRRRALLRFDASAQAGLTVKEAYLDYNVAHVWDGAVHAIVSRLTQLAWTDSATWTKYDGTHNWAAAGGDFTGSVSFTVPAGYVGKGTSPDISSLVTPVMNTGNVDLIVRAQEPQNQEMWLVSTDLASPSFWPTLRLVFEDDSPLYQVVRLGVTETGSLPGPGKIPTLLSPEKSSVLGTLVSLDEDRPGAGQIVLTLTSPNDNSIYPDANTGLCAGSPTPEFPAPPSGSSGSESMGSEPGSAGSSGCADVVGAEMANFSIVMLSPNNNQNDVEVTANLVWTGSLSTGAANPADLTWDVEFATEDGTLTTVAQGLTSTTWSPGGLYATGAMLYGTKYKWRLVARRSECLDWPGLKSPIFHFQTQARFEARSIDPGDYVFSYYLSDSKTGRRSSLSQIGQVTKPEFAVTTSGSQGVAEDSVKAHFIALELLYDSDLFDRAYIFRSMKTQNAGGTPSAAYQWLDAIIDLKEFWTCNVGSSKLFDPAVTSTRQAVYYYRLEDKQLPYQSTWVDRAIFDEKMPPGGAAVFYQTTLLVSKIKNPPPSSSEEIRPLDTVIGLGEIRWSGLAEISPELFPPYNRYTPSVPSDEVVRFMKVADNVIGLSRSRAVFCHKHTNVILFTEVHEGYGLAAAGAVESVGSLLYYLTTKGLKSLSVDGRLDDVRVMDELLMGDWSTDLSHITLAYDSRTGALFVLNPLRHAAAVLWFTTSRMTELEYLSFDLCRSGLWPTSYTGTGDLGNVLEGRALFLQNTPDATQDIDGWLPRVYILDEAGTRTVQGASIGIGSKRITTLDILGDAVVALGADYANDGLVTVGPSVPCPTPILGVDIQGAWLIVVQAKDPSLVGTAVQVIQKVDTLVMAVDDPDDTLAGLLEGDIVVLSPVYFLWVGHNVRVEPDQPEGLDFFVSKQINAIGAAFTDVSGHTHGDESAARVIGSVWKDADRTPVLRAPTTDDEGAPVVSVVGGAPFRFTPLGDPAADAMHGYAGNSVSPGIEIVCPDLDYRLHAVSVLGTVDMTGRPQAPERST